MNHRNQDIRLQPGRDGMEQGVCRLSIQAPPAPVLSELLDRAQAVPAAQRRASWPLPLRVALALLVIGTATLGLQIAGTFVPRKLARLTPLAPVNTAWSAANGYVLEFTVFDENNSLDVTHMPPTPNYERFKAAALDWARQHRLDAAARGYGDSTPEDAKLALVVTRFMQRPRPVKVMTTGVMVSLRLDDSAAVDDLSHVLASLPGVSLPKVTQRSLYFDVGGLTPGLEHTRVQIEGQMYTFPEDFTAEEAQGLYWVITGAQSYSAYYEAWPLGVFDRDNKQSRFQLGDVIRIGFDADHVLTVKTIAADWNPPGAHESSGGRARRYSFALTLPPGTDDKAIDPLVELGRRFDPRPGDRAAINSRVQYAFWLVPRQQLYTSGGASLTADQQSSANAAAASLDSTLKQWIAAHPEVRRSLVWGDRVSGETVDGGPLPVLYTVEFSELEPTEAGPLREVLCSLPGLASPEETVTDFTARAVGRAFIGN
jgi:hypothetical protein